MIEYDPSFVIRSSVRVRLKQRLEHIIRFVRMTDSHV